MTYQSENQETNTGVWQNSTCGGSYSEWMNCNGYISYTSSSARTSSEETERSLKAASTVSEVTIYPNPSKEGLFFVRLPAIDEVADISVFDNQGRLLRHQLSNGETDIKMEMKLKQGVYLVKMVSQSYNVTRKLVVDWRFPVLSVEGGFSRQTLCDSSPVN